MKVIITAKEYYRLLQSENELLALQGAGVDNWSGIDTIHDDEEFVRISNLALPELMEEVKPEVFNG